MWRVPLPAHSGNRAAETQEGNIARNAFAARRHHVGRRDRGACSGTVWLSQPRAMGGAKRDAPGGGIFSSGELRDRADLLVAPALAAPRAGLRPSSLNCALRQIARRYPG